MLKLRECLDFLGDEVVAFRGDPELGVFGVFCDSRSVGVGALFCAVAGEERDGRDCVDAAIAKGAVAVMSRMPDAFPDADAFIGVRNDRLAAAMLIQLDCGRPEQRLELYGVTGTNGKTTSAYAMRRLFGDDCGLLSTIEYFDGALHEPARWTTPSPEVMFPLFSRMADNGCRRVAMELSSHALSQYRTGAARFRGAIFTNLSGDHLDYHKDMESYFSAKKRLFSECLAPDGIAIINCDDAGGRRLASELAGQKVVTFGFGADASELLEILELSAGGSRFRLGGREYFSNLVGAHNVSNLAGAVIAARSGGVPESDIVARLKHISVPGRLERCSAHGKCVFVDYAHTDDALAKVLGFLRGIARGRLIAVFGAGGDRDRTKRPRMGRVATVAADAVIITSDNPRSEKPEAIIAEIAAGADGGAEVLIEPDRAAAIALALDMATPDDIVLIAGKGHEDYQETSGVRSYFSDRAAVESAAAGKSLRISPFPE